MEYYLRACDRSKGYSSNLSFAGAAISDSRKLHLGAWRYRHLYPFSFIMFAIGRFRLNKFLLIEKHDWEEYFFSLFWAQLLSHT